MNRQRRIVLLARRCPRALLEGVAAYVGERGGVLDARMLRSGRVPEDGPVDGLLLHADAGADAAAFVRQQDVPVVGMDACDGQGCACVCCSDDAIGRAAARHLIERGHRTLVFYAAAQTAQAMRRQEGFRKEVESIGAHFVALAMSMQRPGGLQAGGDEAGALQAALGGLGVPFGVMAHDDLDAFTLLDALTACGYHVPEQVAVVGVGNDAVFCDTAPVPLSSVDLQAGKVGYRAAALLGAWMDGAAPPSRPLCFDPGPIVVRTSSDLMALPNLHAARALRFIWTNFRRPINVERVAAQVSVTRRRLQILFQEHVRRTMQEEITRVRMAKACLLLKRSSLRIRQVAELTGFKSSLHLHRTCQSMFQMGPKAFRETGTLPGFGVVPACVGSSVSAAENEAT